MAVLRAFKAIRPRKAYANKVISLPYDVMNRQEAAEMADGNPYSFLHICRAEIDMPEQEDPYEDCVYQRAKANIAQFIEDGIFVQEKKPALYLYRQIMDGRVQTGIVGCAAIDDYINNVIKKHEFTRVEKEQDRINHFDTCNMNTEPVFLTYKDNKKIRSITEGWISNHEPVYDLKTSDGVAHMLWVVDDEPVIGNLIGIFKDIPNLYIADGHHRSASACKVGLKRRGEHPDYTGEEEFNFFMAVIFPDSDLKIFDYNRVVKDLYGNTREAFLERVEKAGFTVEAMGKEIYKPERKHVFGMYLEGEWYRLTAKDEIIPEGIIESLDVSILQDHLLAPVLGIEEPRTDKRIDFVGGIRGLKELERRVKNDMQVAFAVYPVDISDLEEVSDNDMVMPPKSTWFEPKLGSGLFMHLLK